MIAEKVLRRRKRAQRRLEKTVTRTVIIRLHGWPAEVRTFSVVDAFWEVSMEFHVGNTRRSVPYFSSDDYDKSFAKYEMLRDFIVGDQP